MTYIHHFFFRLLVYFNGIKFFKTNDMGDTNLLSSGTFVVQGERQIKFNFYKKTYNDIIYKRGKPIPRVLAGYIVECVFDESFPEHLRAYNGMKFLLRNSRIFFKINEEAILHLLLEFYIDYIKHNLPKED